MRVIETKQIGLQLSDLRIQQRVAFEKGFPEPRPRSKGVHLSGVLKYIATTTGMLASCGDGQDFEEDFPLRMALGMAVESWFQALWPAMNWQPGEVELDGVVGSPDGYTDEYAYKDSRLVSTLNVEYLATILALIDEFKLTYKSSRDRHKNITAEWLWMRQLMSYVFMWSQMYGQKLNHGRLHVVWLNGAYEKFKFGEPSYCTYLIEFSDRELEENWRMVVASRDKAIAEV